MIHTPINLEILKLPDVWKHKLLETIEKHKFLYQPYMETADDFQTLKNRLLEKGFIQLPKNPIPMFQFEPGNQPMTDNSSCKVVKTMIRKK